MKERPNTDVHSRLCLARVSTNEKEMNKKCKLNKKNIASENDTKMSQEFSHTRIPISPKDMMSLGQLAHNNLNIFHHT